MPLLVRKNDRREVRRAHSFACQVVRERDFKLVARVVERQRVFQLLADDILLIVHTYDKRDRSCLARSQVTRTTLSQKQKDSWIDEVRT